jgi:hypothetical protein
LQNFRHIIRYQDLWETPLFAGNDPAPNADAITPATGSTPGYKLLGVGTIRGVDFAYVQSGPNGRIEEVSQDSTSDAVLVRVERSASGELRSVLIRRGGVLLRAETTAKFSPNDPAVPPEVPDDSFPAEMKEDFHSVSEVLDASRRGRIRRE